jgi:hypothetical protein
MNQFISLGECILICIGTTLSWALIKTILESFDKK